MRHALLAFATVATMTIGAAPAAADNPFPVGPPNQPATYGDCVSTTAAGEGVEDYTVGVKRFVQLVGPPASQRPGLEEQFVCKGFSPPPGPQH